MLLLMPSPHFSILIFSFVTLFEIGLISLHDHMNGKLPYEWSLFDIPSTETQYFHTMFTLH